MNFFSQWSEPGKLRSRSPRVVVRLSATRSRRRRNHPPPRPLAQPFARPRALTLGGNRATGGLTGGVGGSFSDSSPDSIEVPRRPGGPPTGWPGRPPRGPDRLTGKSSCPRFGAGRVCCGRCARVSLRGNCASRTRLAGASACCRCSRTPCPGRRRCPSVRKVSCSITATPLWRRARRGLQLVPGSSPRPCR